MSSTEFIFTVYSLPEAPTAMITQLCVHCPTSASLGAVHECACSASWGGVGRWRPIQTSKREKRRFGGWQWNSKLSDQLRLQSGENAQVKKRADLLTMTVKSIKTELTGSEQARDRRRPNDATSDLTTKQVGVKVAHLHTKRTNKDELQPNKKVCVYL